MIEYIKLEIIKIWKLKSFIPVLIILFASFVISFLTTYYSPRFNNTLFEFYYYVFALNIKIIFPISIIVFFSPLIINEYRDKTIKLLWGSKFDKDDIYIGKFISAIIYYNIIFILFLIIYMIVSTNFSEFQNIQTPKGLITKKDIIFRSIMVLFGELCYLFCYASFVFLVSIISKNQIITFLLAISILLINIIIPIPQWISQYMFQKGRMLYTGLYIEKFNYLKILKEILIYIVTMFISLYCGIFISRSQEV